MYANSVIQQRSAQLASGRHRNIFLGACLATTISFPIAAAGSLQLEEVIVTAQKRVQSLQDVPISVSAMSGQKISNVGITSLEEITQYMPSVTINAGASSPNLFIRGIGAGSNSGFEQSVGMSIDGVYAGRGPLAAVPSAMDLERIEVLKGPQGILFGKNTIGGVVNITTAKPTEEFEGMVDALYSPGHGEQQYNVVLSGPLTPSLNGRIAMRYDSLDGWWENVTLGVEGPDAESWYARGSLQWLASDDMEVLLKYEVGDFERNASPVVIYQSDFVGQENFAGTIPIPVVSESDKGAGDVMNQNQIDTDVLALTVNWDLDFAQLTSLTAYSAYNLYSVQNADGVAVGSIDRTSWENYDQYSQELRLVSPGDEKIDWILGGYYQKSVLDISRRNDAADFLLSGPLSVPPLLQTEVSIPSIFDQDSESWAFFGQATWNISNRLRFGLGLRYNEETKKLDKVMVQDGLKVRALGTTFFTNPLNGQLIDDLRQHSFTGLKREEDKWTYSATAQWDATENAMLYAVASTGFKGGGYDEFYSSEGEFVRLADAFTGEPTGEVVAGADASVLNYNEESVLSYEIGAKMRLLDGAAEINLAAFRMEYEDLQTSSLIGDVFQVGNAGKAISQGLEFDGRWLLTERLTIGGAIAYLDATYDEFTGATCTVPQATDPENNPGCLGDDGMNIPDRNEVGGQDLEGESLLFAPDWSANFNIQYIVPLSDQIVLINSGDINYTDEFYSALDLDPNTQHDAATKVNARIAIASVDETWVVALVGKNLTDEDTQRWRNDLVLTNSNSYFGIADRPRSVAIQARYRF